MKPITLARPNWTELTPSRLARNLLLNGIALEVRRRRLALKFTQIKLADKAGVHTNVVGRLERGIYNPTVLALSSIAGALNTSIVDSLRGTPK
ncbi:MAG: helix-turn-helix transcriptional regulator [Steroidobacteraceae bacterium]